MRQRAFTTLMTFQIFNVFNARSDERSAFEGLFRNPWLWAGVALSVLLHLAVIYVPFLQSAFSTVRLSTRDWALCISVASSVLWLREVVKSIRRLKSSRKAAMLISALGVAPIISRPGWKTFRQR